MPDRTKLLVHLRRLSGLFENAFRNGPDGMFLGRDSAEQPIFVHHGCAFYLAGCLAFLEGEDGAYSWNNPEVSSPDFDSFVAGYPTPPKNSYNTRGINKASMNALAQIRNAVIHHGGDLALNRNRQSIAMVTTTILPGVTLHGSVVNIEAPFLEFVRVAVLAVRNYHNEF